LLSLGVVTPIWSGDEGGCVNGRNPNAIIIIPFSLEPPTTLKPLRLHSELLVLKIESAELLGVSFLFWGESERDFLLKVLTFSAPTVVV